MTGDKIQLNVDKEQSILYCIFAITKGLLFITNLDSSLWNVYRGIMLTGLLFQPNYIPDMNLVRSATLLTLPTLVLSMSSALTTFRVMASRGKTPESTLALTI